MLISFLPQLLPAVAKIVTVIESNIARLPSEGKMLVLTVVFFGRAVSFICLFFIQRDAAFSCAKSDLRCCALQMAGAVCAFDRQALK